MTDIILPNGGYRRLKSFQIARMVYDLTVIFVEHYIPQKSRTCDQMIQAARSGVQNIAEGSLSSATSKKTELKLTNVARASLGELQLDFEDFLRQHNTLQWSNDDPRCKALIAERFSCAEDVRDWIRRKRGDGISYAEVAANAILVLIRVAIFLLNKQITRLARDFENEGGFSERLYRTRKEYRK